MTFFDLYGSPSGMARKAALRLARRACGVLQRRRGAARFDQIDLLAPGIDQDELHKLQERLAFYLPGAQMHPVGEDKALHDGWVTSPEPLLVFGARTPAVQRLLAIRPGTFDVDYNTNPMDGWAWSALAAYADRQPPDTADAHARLARRIADLRQMGLPHVTLFGTGPSLEKAGARQWGDGYRVVCNTICRDAELWRHIDPDFIVAGDAIYHFGFTAFARAFRADLRARLAESQALFVYPAQFHAIVRRELAGLEQQLVPVPSGWRKRVDIDLACDFRLPSLGNVLGLLLLPLGCTLSHDVRLWGFDGRAPDDKLFWSNSAKHSYPEHMPSLLAAHPRFFEHHVPAADPNRYVRAVQGDQLDLVLRLAERRGWRFRMLHPSWTETLNKRYEG